MSERIHGNTPSGNPSDGPEQHGASGPPAPPTPSGPAGAAGWSSVSGQQPPSANPWSHRTPDSEQTAQQPAQPAGQQMGEQTAQQPAQPAGQQMVQQPGQQPGQPAGQQPGQQPGQPAGQQPGQPTPQPGQMPAASAPPVGGSPFGQPSGTGGGSDTAVLSAPSAPGGGQPKSHRGRMLLVGLAIGAIIGGGSGAGVAAWLNDDDSSGDQPVQSSLNSDEDADDNTDGQTQQAAAGSVENVAEKVLPSVVSIKVSGQADPFSGGGGQAGGTGVVISSDGEILTNNHVVEAVGPDARVQVTFQNGKTAEAEVVGTDPETDLAVIKAQDVSDLTPAKLGSSSDLAVGEEVVAIGSPLGLDGTVTSGIVSSLQRPVAAGEQQDAGTVIDAIQTDAPINQGNSGGPLVNMKGEVVGINSVIVTTGMDSGSIGLGFSIPIDQAEPIAQELIETGTATHARIGVEVGTPQEGTPGGLVGRVEPNGSAAEAGLQEGDIITKIDDRMVQDHIALIAAARSYRPGDEVTLTYVRDGEEHTAELTLGSDAQTT